MSSFTCPTRIHVCLPFAQGVCALPGSMQWWRETSTPRPTVHPRRQPGGSLTLAPAASSRNPQPLSTSNWETRPFPTPGLRWLFELRHGACRHDVRLMSSSHVPTAPKCERSPKSQTVPLLLPCMWPAEWELWLKEKS